jgi:hypothetical protein
MPGKPIRLAACGLLLAATVASAHAAADPERIARLLAAAAAATGEAELTFEAAAANGNDITITDLKLVVAAEGGVVSVPSVVISGAAEREPGGFTAEGIVFDGGSATSPAGEVKWGTAAIADAIVPSADEVKARARVRPFRKLTLGAVEVNDAEIADPIAIAALSTEIGEIAEGAPSEILVKATGVRLPASFITNPIGAALIERLGYSEFSADITMDGGYDVAADTVTVHALTIDAAEIGKIALTAKFSGMSFRGLSDPEESAAARAAARLDAMTLRFDDAGFVKRMLDMQAGMLGGTPDDVRAQLVYGALPFALSFVDNASFRDEFLAAAATFLEDPRSLVITVAPDAPVPLGQVVHTALRTPFALPDLLTPDVVANH